MYNSIVSHGLILRYLDPCLQTHMWKRTQTKCLKCARMLHLIKHASLGICMWNRQVTIIYESMFFSPPLQSKTQISTIWAPWQIKKLWRYGTSDLSDVTAIPSPSIYRLCKAKQVNEAHNAMCFWSNITPPLSIYRFRACSAVVHAFYTINF